MAKRKSSVINAHLRGRRQEEQERRVRGKAGNQEAWERVRSLATGKGGDLPRTALLRRLGSNHRHHPHPPSRPQALARRAGGCHADPISGFLRASPFAFRLSPFAFRLSPFAFQMRKPWRLPPKKAPRRLIAITHSPSRSPSAKRMIANRFLRFSGGGPGWRSALPDRPAACPRSPARGRRRR